MCSHTLLMQKDPLYKERKGLKITASVRMMKYLRKLNMGDKNPKHPPKKKKEAPEVDVADHTADETRPGKTRVDKAFSE